MMLLIVPYKGCLLAHIITCFTSPPHTKERSGDFSISSRNARLQSLPTEDREEFAL